MSRLNYLLQFLFTRFRNLIKNLISYMFGYTTNLSYDTTVKMFVSLNMFVSFNIILIGIFTRLDLSLKDIHVSEVLLLSGHSIL